jgi:hypothetical protein
MLGKDTNAERWGDEMKRDVENLFRADENP